MFPLVLPSDARRIEDADEEIFLLYSQMQASETANAQGLELGGLGFIDSNKGELFVRIDVTPPVGSSVPLAGPPSSSERSPRRRRAHSKRIGQDEKLHEPVEITLFQDTTALRSRQGDTGSVLWRVSVHLARVLLSQQRFPSESPLLPPAALSTSHVLELGSGTGILSIVLAPYVARYTATDLPSLLPLIRKNQTYNLAPAVLGRVATDDLDWVQLHNTPAHARRRMFSVRTLPPPAVESTPRKGARKKASSSAAAPEPEVTTDRVDLVLAVDCIYNPSLVAPLLSSIDHVAGAAPVLVVLELRSSEVAHEFLEKWLTIPGSWEIWSVPLLGPRYAVWAGRRSDAVQHSNSSPT